jgi:cupin 2 domain-containing protein
LHGVVTEAVQGCTTNPPENHMPDALCENLFAELPSDISEELTEVLANSSHVRIERIVSTGQASPEGFWYDQDEDEWVVVLKGEAKLIFQDDGRQMHMKPGDHINIPAHCKHKILWTTPDEPTVWLAVFFF